MKILAVLVLIFTIMLQSCNLNQTKPMEIKQVKDAYAKKNGGIPNENIFLIENFSNNIEGIISILNYTRDTITKMKPFKKENGLCEFIFNKEDVNFDDGYYTIDAKTSIMISINNKSKYFKLIKVVSDDILQYTLKGSSDICIAYESFNLSVFKTFLDAIAKERNKIKYNYTTKQFEINGKKTEAFKQEYQLINSSEFTLECAITYLDKDNFKIEFPNYNLIKRA